MSAEALNALLFMISLNGAAQKRGQIKVDEQKDRDRNIKIAKNEAQREVMSDTRVSAWAIAFAVLLGLAAIMLYLMSR